MKCSHFIDEKDILRCFKEAPFSSVALCCVN